MLLLGLALGAFLVRVARALAGRADTAPRRSFAALWLLSTASLVAIYVAQELLEGVFAAGHPPGSPGCSATAAGGRSPPPSCVGAALAALLRLASAVVVSAARLAARPAPDGGARAARAAALGLLAAAGVLASAAAGRAPPLT